MFVVYDLIFLILTIFYLPLYLLKGKFHKGFFMRLGILPENLSLNKPIWIHAVSVGEAMSVKGLLQELRKVYPGSRFVVSTVTATGNRVASGIVKNGDFLTYLPFDFSFIVRSVIDKIDPSLFVITETEIWPNLLTCLYGKKIPVVLVNGRISDSSFKGYSCIKFLLRPILKKISLFCLQTERDAQRFMRLGVSKDKIQVTGNMKFDAEIRMPEELSLRKRAGERLFVAGSTHSGEEEIILDAFKGLCKEFPWLRLLVAPRHPERVPEVERLIVKYGFNPARISRLNGPVSEFDNGRAVFVLDTVGQLVSYYAIADIVFVGGSLIKKGGHNILEPASQGKPVIFGPYMHNFKDIADLFLGRNAAILARNQEEIKTNVKYLLGNPGKMTDLGRIAKELVLENQGATIRNLEFIRRLVGAAASNLKK